MTGVQTCALPISKGSPFRDGWFECFFCLGTEGSKGSLFRNVWFRSFSVEELNVPKVPYLEMGTEGYNG